jgi:signal peptidase II
MSTTRPGWAAFAAVVVLAVGADVGSKEAIFARLGMPGTSPAIVLVPRLLTLETNLNEGALFGMGQGMGGVFAAVSIAALGGIVAMVARADTRQSLWLVVSLALICGGIIGNLYDRLGLPGLRWHLPPERTGQPVYAVRDWIHFTLPGVIDWPIFNLADSFLVIGAGMLLVATLTTPSAPANSAASPR